MSFVSVALVKELMELYGFTPSKALGQNFLVDANIAQKISKYIQLDEPVLEIGPGLGSLSIFLAKRTNHIVAVEYDKHVIAPLKDILAKEGVDDRVTIINDDIMKVDIQEICLRNKITTIIGNLPYNISAPLVANIARYVTNVSELIVMVQKEVGERIIARESTRAVSAISLKCQYFMNGEILFKVAPQSFFPKPKVDSIVIRMSRYHREDHHNIELLFHIIDSAFSQRRKMLRQSLKPILGTNILDILKMANVDCTNRAENCTLDNFIEISKIIESSGNDS